MTKDEFRRLLHSGHGRAVQHALANDVSTWRDVIADMSLHSRSIDPIFEGTHAAYIYNFLEILPDATTYHPAIIESLADTKDDLDARHRFTLASFLAEDGNTAARAAMYAHYNPGPEEGELIAIDFVALDGLKGFLFAAEKIGALLRDPDNTVDECLLLSEGKEHCGEEELLAALNAAATTNEDLAAYLKTATGPPRDRQTSARSERIKWGREATPEALLQAAQTLAETKDPELLPIFLRRPFPLHPAPLIAMADHRDALIALTKITHPQLRGLAIQLVESNDPNRHYAADLLLNNARPGDEELALRWYLAEQDPEVRHIQEIALRKTDSIPILKAIYERSPCSENRAYTVKDLIDRNEFPAEWLEECQYDANDATREITSALRSRL